MSSLASSTRKEHTSAVSSIACDPPSSSSPGRDRLPPPICDDGGEPPIAMSVHDLLDHTWHYQCVVSPTFSPATIVADHACSGYNAAPNHTMVDLQTVFTASASSVCLNPAGGGYVSLASLIHNMDSPPSSRQPPTVSTIDPSAIVGADENDPDYLEPRSVHHHHHSFDIFSFVRKMQISRPGPLRRRSSTSATPSCRDPVGRSVVASRRIGAVAA